jgi:hypothetical protein
MFRGNTVIFYEEPTPKRTLGIRDKQILYRKAKGRCENPACSKKLEFDEMQVGHKTAWSKGGSTTLKSCVCLCYRCNKLQRTDSWSTFLKKQGVADLTTRIKNLLNALKITQLKSLAAKHGIKVTGYIEESLFETHRIAPTKSQYVNKLSRVVTEKEIQSIPKETPKKVKKRKKREVNNSWW